MFISFSSGGAGAVDRERRTDPGEQRPDLPAAEDSFRTDSLFLHPADLSFHLREQKDGHHRQGVDLFYNNMMCEFCVVSCFNVFVFFTLILLPKISHRTRLLYCSGFGVKNIIIV